MVVSLKEFLTNVLLLQPSVFDALSSSGVTDNLQECTNFFNGDDWREVLRTTNSASPVVVRKLTRLSELISKTSVEEVGMLTTLEQFNNLYATKFMSPKNNDNSGGGNKKRKQDHNNKKHKKRKAAPQPHHHHHRRRRLCLDDVVAPADPTGTSAGVADNNEASIDPPPRFDAVARGMLWRRDHKELRFDGMWASSREAFDDDKSPKSEISFWLEENQGKEEEPTKLQIQQSPPTVGRLKTTGQENDGGQLIPIDSANFQGFFKVQRNDGAYDTFTDDQIVLKFRENNLGGYNVYGKGRNMIGLFTISGTVASEWGTSSNSSHAELYRTYLLDGPPEDTTSTDATADSSGSPIQSASKTNSNSFPVGTAVRKFFVPDGETHARPFVGYIIDVFDCEEEIDGRVVISSQHSILYEDGDVEDLDYWEIKPSIDDAKRNKIANMDLTELKEWETNFYQKYPKREPSLSPGKRISSQQQHQNQQNQDSSVDLYDPLPLDFHQEVPSAGAAAAAAIANRSHQQGYHESSEEQSASQPPLWQQQQQQQHATENGSRHYEYGRVPKNQQWPQQHAYHQQHQYHSYNKPPPQGQLSQRHSYHQTPGETRNHGPDSHQMSQQDHWIDEMRKLAHVMIQYLNKTHPDLYRKAVKIIQTCSQRYPQSSKEKYRRILFYSKKLVGDEIWNKVYNHYRNWRLEIRRRNMEARSGQSSQQETSQTGEADPATFRRGNALDYQNSGMLYTFHDSLSARQQQQNDTRHLPPTHGVAPPNVQLQDTMADRPQYGSPTHFHHTQRPHSMPPSYGRHSNFQHHPSIANRQQYNPSAYDHPNNHPSLEQRSEGGSSFRLEPPTAHRRQHDASSRSDPRNSNGNGDHVDLTNSDDEDFDLIQNANVAGEPENLCLPQESNTADENLIQNQLPANDETVVNDQNKDSDAPLQNANVAGEPENLCLTQEPNNADDNLTQNQRPANDETVESYRNEDSNDILQKIRKDLKAEADSSDDDSSSGDEEPLTENEVSGKEKWAKGKNDDIDDIVQKVRKDLEAEGDRIDDDSSSGDEEPLTENELPGNEKGSKGKNDDNTDDIVQKVRKDLEADGDRSDDDCSSGDEESRSNRQQNENPPKGNDILSDDSSDDDSDVELDEKYRELVSGSPKKKKKGKKKHVAVDL